MLPISSLPFSHRSANPVDPSSSSSSFPLTQEGRRRRRGVQNNNKNSVRMGISSNSSSNWQWQRALGQLFNREGAASLLSVAASEPRLALPHLSVPDIRWVDWPTLHRLGFRGVVFDKDNTLTAPYSLSLWPPLDPSFRLCRSTFPAGSIAIFSNSAGARISLLPFLCCNSCCLTYLGLRRSKTVWSRWRRGKNSGEVDWRDSCYQAWQVLHSSYILLSSCLIDAAWWCPFCSSTIWHLNMVVLYCFIAVSMQRWLKFRVALNSGHNIYSQNLVLVCECIVSLIGLVLNWWSLAVWREVLCCSSSHVHGL